MVQRQTRQKDAIREALRENDEFISAQDLHRWLEEHGTHIGLATVYRQLNALADAGLADTIRLDGQQLFRLCGDDGHHHHLVCVRCGRNRGDRAAQRIVAARHRATPTGSRSNRTRLRCSACVPIAVDRVGPAIYD